RFFTRSVQNPYTLIRHLIRETLAIIGLLNHSAAPNYPNYTFNPHTNFGCWFVSHKYILIQIGAINALSCV
ncbi:hypothetical protein, partial [Alicyclobacillus fodiniaquatilis]